MSDTRLDVTRYDAPRVTRTRLTEPRETPASNKSRIDATLRLPPADHPLPVPIRLCLAAAEDDVDLIHDIVERGGVPATSHEPLNRMTPTHFASRAGNVLAIVALQKLGADVNAVDADLNSPLVLAVESHQKDAAHTLMQMGATLQGNVQKAAHKGIVANRIANRLRELATRNDQRKFIGYLAAGADPNHLAGQAGSLESHAQSKATAHGRQAHLRGRSEVHTLHTAVARGSLDVVR